jgi:hypothetical protein
MQSSTIPLFFQLLLVVVLALALAGLILAILGNKINSKWSKTSSYNVAGCLVVSSIIAGTISFLAVWIALPNSNKVDYTHQDVVVDILGVLVTVLIGWNILSVVDIKKKAEKIDTISDDLESVISGIIQLSIHSFTIRPEKEAVINSCFMSLEKILECENEKVKATAINEIMEVLYQVKRSYKNGQNASIYADMKSKYEFILSKVDNVYRDEISDMINSSTLLAANDDGVRFANAAQRGSIYATGGDIQQE